MAFWLETSWDQSWDQLERVFRPKKLASRAGSTKYYLATNQKVGSSNLSGRTILLKHLPTLFQHAIWDYWDQQKPKAEFR